MSKVVPGHPGEERLLRFADGELPPRQSAEIRAHLEACWECRAELDTLQTAVAECIHYRKSVLQVHLPPPPSAPWPDLTARFRAIDAGIAGESSWWRSAWDALSAPKFWVPAVALGLVMTLVVVPWLQVTPTVQAAELLRKAVAVAAESKPRARSLQVRTKTKRILRAAASPADLRPVAALFESAGYDWADPLSAKAYLNWNTRLAAAAKTDEVLPEGNTFYEVRTRSTEGEMTEATLRLRQSDLQPVQGTFKFRNDEWVELTEVPAAEPGPAAPIASTAAPARVVNPTTSTPDQASSPSASAAAELRVLEALHRIGADLGDPLEISRAASQVSVRGFGVDPRRRAQIEQALRGVPGVTLEFATEGAPAAGAAPSASRHLAVKSSASPLEPLLEQRLGSRAALEQFTNEILDRDEQIMARAHAIERLASRFPDPASLAPSDLSSYRALQRNHAQALLQLQRELARVLQPVSSTATAAPSGKSATPASLLQAARQLEASLSSLLGAASFSGDVSALPGRIGAELAALEQLTRTFLESMGQ